MPTAKRKNDLLIYFRSVSSERALEIDQVLTIFESALGQALRKIGPEYKNADFRAEIDAGTGKKTAFRRWQVLADDAEMENPDAEIYLKDVAEKENGEDLKAGDYYEEPMDGVEIEKRVVMHSARQLFQARLRDAQRRQLADEMLANNEEMVHGTVLRVLRDKGDVILDVNKVDCRLPKREMIPRESPKVGDKVRALIKETLEETRGPQIILNRTSPEFLACLMRMAVPEIEKGILEIVATVRSPGNRAKVAVRTHDQRVDPVGTCVGIRGSRVQSVTNELNGERIDIIQWDEDMAKFALRALAPAEVKKISIDAERNRMDVLVEADNLAQAIGKNGTNVRLAAELTGWELNLVTPDEYHQEQEKTAERRSAQLAEALDLDAAVARILYDEGFEVLDQIAFCELSELTGIEGFNEEIAEDIRTRANEAVEKRESDLKERIKVVDEHLKNLGGMDTTVLYELLAQGVTTLEGLAELGVEELVERIEIPDTRAEQLIVAAREGLEAQGKSVFGE